MPQPFRVYDEQGMVMIEGDAAGRHAAEVAETVDEPGDPIEKTTRAARESLATVQGYVVDNGLPAWPADAIPVPMPKVEVNESRIRMWFENDQDQIVLEAPFIDW